MFAGETLRVYVPMLTRSVSVEVHQDSNATVEISEGMNSRAYLVRSGSESCTIGIVQPLSCRGGHVPLPLSLRTERLVKQEVRQALR